MPKLSFSQLTKVFGAGFVGYALLVTFGSISTAVIFPEYVKLRFDMLIHTFLESVLFYFGFFGLFATCLGLLLLVRGIIGLFRGKAPAEPR
jgi:hypothetical protein